jgi:methionyl-tRNA synthetase
MEKVRLKEGVAIMMSLVNEANRYFNSMAPWKLVKEDRDRCMTVLNVSLQVAKVIAYGMYPYIPHSMRRWCSLVGFKDPQSSVWTEALEPVEPGKSLVSPPPLFQKLDLNKEEDKATAERPIIPEKDQITIDQFGAMDLRVGKVIEAIDHPKADKLYVLKVDVGDKEPRQIITGLRGHYRREDLVGRTIIVLCNLKPANMRGLTSNGMLLASEEGDEVILLTTERLASAGSRVH